MTSKAPIPIGRGLSRRNAPRVKTELQVQVIGVDSALRARNGDISMSGLYIDIDHEVGALGSVQRLRVASPDLALKLVLLGRVVRLATVNDFWRGNRVAGVAFEFLCEEVSSAEPAQTVPIEESTGLRGLVHYLAQQSAWAGTSLDHIWPATLESSLGPERAAATVTGVSLQGTVLETDFPIPMGEMIRVEIPGPGPEQRVSLIGRAIETRALDQGGQRFRTMLSFGQQAERPRSTHGSIDDALGALLTSAPAPAAAAHARKQLAGELGRISLPTVLLVCELEHVSGILQLQAADHLVSCYLLDGRLIDVETPDSQDPQAALADVLDWEGGRFEFLSQPVSRPDRIGMPASVLMLTLLKLRDERPVARGP